MSEYTIDVNVGTRAIRNILTERTIPALEKEQRWLLAAWSRFDELPDDHKLNVKSMKALLARHEQYVAALSSAHRAGLDDERFDTEQLTF